MVNIWLVVTGTMEFHDFPYIGNVIILTDEVIFCRGVYVNHQLKVNHAYYFLRPHFLQEPWIFNISS